MSTRLNKNAQAVLDVVKNAPNHPTAADIYEEVRGTRPKIGIASVYRILHTLVQDGYLKELRHYDESCRYDAHTSRHDHAICTGCGALIDIPVDVQVSLPALQQAATAAGIQLSTHEVRLYGLCQRCHSDQLETISTAPQD